MKHITAVLPCAGNQTRMKELVFSKELLPLFDGRPVIQHSIDALRLVTPEIIAIVNPKKTDLIEYLKKQHIHIHAQKPLGLPVNIATAAKSKNTTLLFALPDTYYQPADIFIRLIEHREPNVIGLFQSKHPENFDSVRTYKDRITQYAVKIDPPLSSWTMGCGKLSPQAIDLLKHAPKSTKEPIFGHLIHMKHEMNEKYCLNYQYHPF